MKKTIHLGAYGWRHKHWLNVFYPDDMPQDDPDEDWLLTYYSNIFDTVLVPADYWCANDTINCKNWLDDVHEKFQFFIECHACIFDRISTSDWLAQLRQLKSQLQGIVVSDVLFVENNTQLKEGLNSLNVPIWQPNNIWQKNNKASSNFAYVESNLLDLRAARRLVDDFVSASDNAPLATIIVKHGQLKADNLVKFRTVLEIMGH